MGCGQQALPCTFYVGYINQGTLWHCNLPFACFDPNQVLGPSNLDKRSAEEIATATGRSSTLFKTDSGLEVTFPFGVNIGDRVATVEAINETLHLEQAQNHVFLHNHPGGSTDSIWKQHVMLHASGYS